MECPPMIVHTAATCVFALPFCIFVKFPSAYRCFPGATTCAGRLQDCAGLFWCTSCANPTCRPAKLSWPGALQHPMRSQEVSPAPFPAVHSSVQLLAEASMPLCREARYAARPAYNERTMLAVRSVSLSA